MSISASIDLRIVTFDLSAAIPPMKTIELLMIHGWNPVNPDGEVNYLPLGDNEMFNWTHSKISVASLIKILEEKEHRGELVGVTMTWQNTFIGGQVLLRREKEMLQEETFISMSFSLTINRKILTNSDNFKITDVNWYLERLLPIFNQGDTRVEYFTYEENI